MKTPKCPKCNAYLPPGEDQELVTCSYCGLECRITSQKSLFRQTRALAEVLEKNSQGQVQRVPPSKALHLVWILPLVIFLFIGGMVYFVVNKVTETVRSSVSEISEATETAFDNIEVPTAPRVESAGAPSDFRKRALDAIPAWLKEQGLLVQELDCPELASGATQLRCRVIAKESENFAITILVTHDAIKRAMRISHDSKIVIANIIERDLAAQLGASARGSKIDCGVRVRPAIVGESFRCQNTTSHKGTSFSLEVTILDEDGGWTAKRLDGRATGH